MMRKTRRDPLFNVWRSVALAAILWMFGFLSAAFAQESPALYDGPDRAAKILAAAKAEGSLTVYASMAEKDIRRLVSEFERRTGIKVNLWRAGKDKVLQRVVTEARAGRFVVDFVHNPSPEMEALHRERLLQEVRSPATRNVIPSAIPPPRYGADRTG